MHTLLLALVGCSSPDADVTATIQSVTPEGVTLSLQTDPGLIVGLRGSGKRVDIDGSGAGTMTLTTTEIVGSVVYLDVFASSLFGSPSRVGSGELDLGFDPYQLTQLRTAPDRSWAGVLKPTTDRRRCLRFSGDVVNGEVGTTTTFVAPPGTTIEVGELDLKVGDDGRVLWKPDGPALEKLVRLGQVSWTLPGKLASPGLQPVEGDVRIQLEPGCRPVLSAHLAHAVEKGTHQPAKELQRWAIATRLDGDLLTTRARREPPAPKEGYALNQARWMAIEHAVSEEQDEEECVWDVAYYDVVERGSGKVVTSAVSESKTRPSRVRTRVDLHDLSSGKIVASGEFEPSASGCASRIFPRKSDVESWVGKQLR